MAVHVYISGFVQGIGFRQFLKNNARKLNIKGWVKNLPDGRVEAMFAGDQSNIKTMVEFCRKGPFLAEVKNVETEEIEDQEFEDFEIIKD